MSQSPAFQFYPADFLADENVALMSLAGRGAYITLICYCWREGSIPADMGRMGRLCGVDSSAMAQLWSELWPCFQQLLGQTEEQPARYIHPRLERERVKQQEHSRERQESGRKGANLRWEKEKGQSEDNREDGSSAIAKPLAQLLANDASSSSSSSSSSTSIPPSGGEEKASRAKTRSAPRPKTCDEEYLEELQKNPAYAVFDVKGIYHKMVAWCQVRGKEPTRLRLVNWLNREDKPMVASGAGLAVAVDKSRMVINPDTLSPKTRGNAYALEEFLNERRET